MPTKRGPWSLAQAETYDPGTELWSVTGDMTRGRATQIAVRLPSGRVLLAGGGVYGWGVSSAELYDPASRSWTATMPMSEARTDHTGSLLADGSVLVAGGGSGQEVPTTEVFSE